MTYAGSASDTIGASSSQPSTSLVIGSIYNYQVPIQSTNIFAKFINQYEIFQFEEDATTTPWHVSFSLSVAPTTHPLQKFKEHSPRFSGNNYKLTHSRIF
jgi:hypothetical protein